MMVFFSNVCMVCFTTLKAFGFFTLGVLCLFAAGKQCSRDTRDAFFFNSQYKHNIIV